MKLKLNLGSRSFWLTGGESERDFNQSYTSHKRADEKHDKVAVVLWCSLVMILLGVLGFWFTHPAASVSDAVSAFTNLFKN